MKRRVVVTGIGAISPLGHDWPTVREHLLSMRNAVAYIPEWDVVEGLHTRLGARAKPFDLPAHYTPEATRQMGRLSIMATRASELALADAGLTGHALVNGGQMGVAYGSSMGEPAAIGDMASLIHLKNTSRFKDTTYRRMVPETTALSVCDFLDVRGRVITTSSACTSSSQAIGYAFESIQNGKQIAMLAGGSDQLDAADAAVFDTLFATSTQNDKPGSTPAPFESTRDGLVLGEGACTLVLEELAHALARGATVHAELVGFGTNSDGQHVTNPSPATMARAMELALEDAGLQPSNIGYINAHGTATGQGDPAEAEATHRVFGGGTPISSLKSYMGHTLGASGSLEAWMTISMMNEGWFAPTVNLVTPDPACAPLDYIQGAVRHLNTDLVMTNNFAFGGLNTSLIFRRWRPQGLGPV